MLPGWSNTAVPLAAVAKLKLAASASGPLKTQHPPASRLQNSPKIGDVAAAPAAPTRASKPPSKPAPRSASMDELMKPAEARGARLRAARPPPRPSRRRAATSSSCLGSGGGSSGGGGSSSSSLGAATEPPSALLKSLAKCQASSDAIMGDLRKTFKSRYDRSDVILQLSTRYLLVGTCEHRFSGVARFEGTEVVYVFEHPQHRHVEMHMRYADMAGVRTTPSAADSKSPEFRFRIVNPLSYFTREYDPANAAHDLRIGFGDEADLLRFREEVLPRVVAHARK